MPDRSGREIVLSLSRLDRIREIDPLSNTITAEAGVILEKLHAAADAADRLFPLTLASQGSCQIGGNLSSNAGGTGVLAYGNARELCLGVEVVLPTGEVLDDLRKLKKDNTGYDLKNLFVGAEGTLGVITAAVLKLFPKPKGREVAWVGMSVAGRCAEAFRACRRSRRPSAHRLRADRRNAAVLRRKACAGRRQAAGRRLAVACADGDFLGPLCGGCARSGRGYPRGGAGGGHRSATRRSPRASARQPPSGSCAKTFPDAQRPGGRLDQARHFRAGRLDPRIHRACRESRRVRLAGRARRLLRAHGRRQSALQHLAARRRRCAKRSFRSTGR